MTSARRPASRALVGTVAAAGLAVLTACGSSTDEGPTGPGSDGSLSGNVTASVQLTDSSQPEMSDGSSASLTGTATFEGVEVELWDGEKWLSLTEEPATVEVSLADGQASTTLAPAQEIPAGDYEKARVTASEAVIDADVTLDGSSFSVSLQPRNSQVVVEATVTAEEAADGSQTFHVDLALVEQVEVREDASTGFRRLVVTGDAGEFEATVSVSGSVTASVVAVDQSPSTFTTSDGTEVQVEGSASFEGLKVELWDGEQWLTVVDGAGSADLVLGDDQASATLMPAQEIPAGDYDRVRVTAETATLDLTVTVDGGELTREVALTTADEPLVVGAPVTVSEASDGSQTFTVDLTMVQDVTLDRDGSSGPTVTLDVAGTANAVVLGG